MTKPGRAPESPARSRQEGGGEPAASVEVTSLDPAGFVAARDRIAFVYQEAFAQSEYPHPEREVARFAEVLGRHSTYEGFRCRVAREGPGGEVVGVAYGYTGKPGQWWHDIVAGSLGPARAERWLGDCFELVELHLLPHLQGRGVGGRLHDALLDGVPHRTAALSTVQAETPALRLYRKRGWLPLLEHFSFPGGSRPFLILGRDLEGTRAG